MVENIIHDDQEIQVTLNLIAEQKDLIDEYAQYADMNSEDFILEAVFETISELQSAAQAYSRALDGSANYSPDEFIRESGFDKELLEAIASKFRQDGIY